ncbi:MAG: transporter related [Paenibacillus sp.]|jgi:peptide/nickel transport system ATP-binding protein|nr:transporter related [Paenibacillus sp.]
MLLDGNNLGFQYKKNDWVFRGFNIAIQPGEIVGLVGPSGCGKTTLGRVLAGYDKPHEGRVVLHGSTPYKKGYNPIQMVFQHPEKAVNPRWKMRRMVQEGWEIDSEFLEELGIEEVWMDRWPNELSGGELQRFCVARSLGPLTKFLIADEMTTMLDAVTQAQIWHALLGRARQLQLGMLVISHDEHLVNRICHRVIHWNSSDQ